MVCSVKSKRCNPCILDGDYKNNRDRSAVFSPFGDAYATKDNKSGLFSGLGISLQYDSQEYA